VSLGVAAICPNVLFHCHIAQGVKVISVAVDASSIYPSNNELDSAHVNTPLSDQQL
jgi:hypothetical protein